MSNQTVRIGCLEVNAKALGEVCRRWQVAKLEAFGSVVREDFGPESDVDLLVTYREDYRPGFEDLCKMEEDFRDLLGRKVDITEPHLLKWVIRDRVLREARLVHAA